MLATSELVEPFSPNTLHHIEQAAIRGGEGTNVMHGHDAGMLELAGDLRLFNEAGLLLGVLLVEHEFDGDFTAELLVFADVETYLLGRPVFEHSCPLVRRTLACELRLLLQAAARPATTPR